MGVGRSSIASCRNDYELAIRASKEIEFILETQFGAPNCKQSGLHDKIGAARLPGTGEPLNQPLVKKLRFLATVRNQLIHDHDVHTISNRRGFIAAYEEAESELKAMANQKEGRGCVIC